MFVLLTRIIKNCTHIHVVIAARPYIFLLFLYFVQFNALMTRMATSKFKGQLGEVGMRKYSLDIAKIYEAVT